MRPLLRALLMLRSPEADTGSGGGAPTSDASAAPASGAAPAAGATNPGDPTQAKPADKADGAPAPDASSSAASDEKKPADDAAAKPDEKKDEKPADDKKDADFEPTLPDGFEVDPAIMGDFKAAAKELGLKGEAAQKLVDLHVKTLQGVQAKLEEARTAYSEGLLKSLREDKELGGEALEKSTKSTALRALEKFGTPELRQALEESGFGNHPELVRFAYRVGKSLRGDSVTRTNGNPPPASSSEEDLLRQRYPSMFPKES